MMNHDSRWNVDNNLQVVATSTCQHALQLQSVVNFNFSSSRRSSHLHKCQHSFLGWSPFDSSPGIPLSSPFKIQSSLLCPHWPVFCIVSLGCLHEVSEACTHTQVQVRRARPTNVHLMMTTIASTACLLWKLLPAC